MASYTDGLIAHGAYLIPPVIVGIPDGMRLIKVRARSDELTTVFLKSDFSVEQWHVSPAGFTQDGRAMLQPLHPIAQNIKKAA